MKKEITEVFLKSLKAPESGRVELSDTKRLGLRLRHYAPSIAFPKGKAVWMYEKRVKGGKKRKHTFGNWPTVSLSDARATALEIEAEAAKGIDRVAVSKKARLDREAASAGLTTVQEVIDTYSKMHLATLRTGPQCKRTIKMVFSKRLDGSISEITNKDIQVAIDEKITRGHRVYANRIRAITLAFTKWSWQRGYTDSHVGFGIPKATKETPRDRVLSLTEVNKIWEATFAMGDIWGPMLRLVILTGQRRGELSKLKWTEIDATKRRITKLGATTKNARPHITHLSPPALEEIKALKPNDFEYIFTTTGSTPVSGFSKMKTRLNKLLGSDFEPWNVHDIRTAMATALAESGVSETIVDRILNHQASGSAPSSVARVYNQAQQLPERARALEKWAEMVTGETAKIVRMTK